MMPPGFDCELRGQGIASAYAARLLTSLGIEPRLLEGPGNVHPAIAGARSGVMALTGYAAEPPRLCIAPLASCAEGVLKALAALAPTANLDKLHAADLLAERAAVAGYRRGGTVSPGGSCHLLDCADGPIALNLAREDDWALLPAWLETDCRFDGWAAVAAALRERRAAELIERGRMLGLAVVSAGTPLPQATRPSWHSLIHSANARSAPQTTHSSNAHPLVIDLSSLWAGPLCSHLLQKLGARVIKVESSSRPDGARSGPSAFFDLLNAGKQSVALDLRSAKGRDQLKALLLKADIVIEASRPRALRQLGLHAEQLIESNPRLTWIGISGYGRGIAEENWIAYGDDAGVAAGLSQLMHETTGDYVLVGDAIADPLTGLHAALAAWASHLSGGGRLISLSLCEVVRHCLAFDLPGTAEARRARHSEWSAILANAAVIPAAPHARAASAKARPLGADTESVLTDLGIGC